MTIASVEISEDLRMEADLEGYIHEKMDKAIAGFFEGEIERVAVDEKLYAPFIGKGSAEPKGVVNPKAEPRYIKLRPAPKNLKLICGHKLDPLMIPNTNCQDCWKVFFISNREMTHKNILALSEGGLFDVTAAHGNKYVKNLIKFVGFIQEVKQRSELDAN